MLFVEDLRLVKQDCTWTHVKFDDDSVADFFDEQVDLGRSPEQFARVWVHTHPGDCPLPSCTDEQTFDRVFGRTEWAVMAILSRQGPSYARLRFNAGPGGEIEIPITVDYSRPFEGSDRYAWEQEYGTNVLPEPPIRAANARRRRSAQPASTRLDDETENEFQDAWFDYLEDEENPKGFEF
ncbi:hypothetical protein Pla8534_22710 [Lignipirellula cremea]|uniref:JAB domain-containing protein n=1 Tax=Lignipirellula cremea TaxID=2528010 RepID=A0A518DRL0_9BACT|nr:hypothetical protein Pla8534_22710 [Lignipirellula cremea]